jgi:hypothetical protein
MLGCSGMKCGVKQEVLSLLLCNVMKGEICNTVTGKQKRPDI